MAIAFDNSTIDSSSSARSSASFSHTCTGSDLTLVVIALVHNNFSNVPTTSAITYNGVSMSKKATSLNDAGAANLEATIWTLDNPATGSNTVSVTISDADALSSAFIVLSFTGANNGVGANFITASTGSGTSISDSFTTGDTNSWIIGGGLIHGGDTDPFSIGGDLDNERADGATGGHATADIGYFAGDGDANAASDTVTFTASVSDQWALVALELLEAATGGSLPPRRRPVRIWKGIR